MRIYLAGAGLRDRAGRYHVDVAAITPRSRRLIRRVYWLARRNGTSAIVSRWHVVELLELETTVTADRLAAVG